ncbi:Pentatricopeptide repeat-containing protein [Vitis vinifera]|uniref:Pentatricopeptide repeat-containing protein n=1 Tax=Vitis vinifera TaxID=29760 RepID=A0A438JI32_VITVI|nr:Pentatricopeptide repeat-containing protein [Vitis vinifera]
MHGRNCALDDARQLFDELLEPDAICWTSIISALTRNDFFDEALRFFYSMQRDHGMCPDGFTFGTVLTACGNLGRLKQGKEVHAKVITTGFCGNVVVESSLVDMYGKCGSVGESQRIFDRMPIKNSVSWSALLGDTVRMETSSLAAVRQGKEVHCQYIRKGDASQKFDNLELNDWGFAQNGRGEEALRIFNQMVKEGIKPDYISFIGILFACSHRGLVDEGREYFISMTKDYGIKVGIEHYSCMVDLLGRAGLLEEAEILIETSDFRDDSSLWAALLGACTTCTNYEIAERIAKEVGRWNDALRIRRLMKDRGVNKMPGKSWIETKNNLGSSFDFENSLVPGESNFLDVEGMG